MKSEPYIPLKDSNKNLLQKVHNFIKKTLVSKRKSHKRMKFDFCTHIFRNILKS